MPKLGDTAAAMEGKTTFNMMGLLVLSIFFATANNILYKASLNAFSSPTTNYGFFTSQFSTLMYTVQAIAVSIALMVHDFRSFREAFMQTPMSVFIIMGLLDSASATLGAISGVNCPGGVQTILNQTVIPMTMVAAACFLRERFEGFQIWGACFILLGAAVASADYLMYPATSDQNVEGTATIAAAIALYTLSVLPSAASNIYKEHQLKQRDMNEVHTTTLVSFWQLWFGFLYLPLLVLPQLGGLSYEEMSTQLSDGYACFRGTNPHDPDGDCSHAASLLLVYVGVNFMYNLLMLRITKRGSAVLLVISQALSLPVTNIAFTMRTFMGADAEPLTALDLLGLVLVCIGFLIYAGFGLAPSFMVAQGPVGQMAYVHIDHNQEALVPIAIAGQPAQLVELLVHSAKQQHQQQHQHDPEAEAAMEEKQRMLPPAIVPAHLKYPIAGYGALELAEEEDVVNHSARAGSVTHTCGDAVPDVTMSCTDVAELAACLEAQQVLTQAQRIVQRRIGQLQRQAEPATGLSV